MPDFASLHLHDWRLVAIRVESTSEEQAPYDHVVTLVVREDNRDKQTPAQEYQLTFNDMRGIRLSLDLVAKALCADALWSNSSPSLVAARSRRRWRAWLHSMPRVLCRRHTGCVLGCLEPSALLDRNLVRADPLPNEGDL